jgi:hypothetical protein
MILVYWALVFRYYLDSALCFDREPRILVKELVFNWVDNLSGMGNISRTA